MPHSRCLCAATEWVHGWWEAIWWGGVGVRAGRAAGARGFSWQQLPPTERHPARNYRAALVSPKPA